MDLMESLATFFTCCGINSLSAVLAHEIAPYRLGSRGLAQRDCCTRVQER